MQFFDKVISIKLADVTEGVSSDEGDTGNGRTKSDSETVDEQIEKKGKNLPWAMPESTHRDLGQSATQEIWQVGAIEIP